MNEIKNVFPEYRGYTFTAEIKPSPRRDSKPYEHMITVTGRKGEASTTAALHQPKTLDDLYNSIKKSIDQSYRIKEVGIEQYCKETGSNAFVDNWSKSGEHTGKFIVHHDED